MLIFVLLCYFSYGESIFSMSLRRIVYLTKWISFQHFILCTFNVMKNFQELLQCEIFARSTSSGTSSSFCYNTFSVMSLSLPSLSSSAAHVGSPKGRPCPSSHSQLLFLLLYSIQISLPGCYHFLDFLLHFHLCWPIPLSNIHSYKLWHGFIHRERGNTTRRLAVCELNKDVPWPITNRLWKKWCDWLLIMTGSSIYIVTCELKS